VRFIFRGGEREKRREEKERKRDAYFISESG
jgi:hypothetical protein